MEICSRFTGMERKNGAFLLHTDNANVKVCFVTDEIVRVRASFDHELAEESYVLMTTAWEDRIKLLPDAALYRSTRIHHTPDSYTKRELVGAGPPSILLRKTVRSLKSPTGAFIAALRFANANFLKIRYFRQIVRKYSENFGEKRESDGFVLLICFLPTAPDTAPAPHLPARRKRPPGCDTRRPARQGLHRQGIR